MSTKTKKLVQKESGNYVHMPEILFNQMIAALQECKNYFDYMKGHNHVASREARELTDAVLKRANS